MILSEKSSPKSDPADGRPGQRFDTASFRLTCILLAFGDGRLGRAHMWVHGAVALIQILKSSSDAKFKYNQDFVSVYATVRPAWRCCWRYFRRSWRPSIHAP
jgi:hypothetical protein